MNGRRKPRDPDAPTPSGWTLADYKRAGVLDTPLPARMWLVVAPDGHQFSVHPFNDEGHAEAQTTADRIHGTIEEYKPKPSTYWKTGETHYDH